MIARLAFLLAAGSLFGYLAQRASSMRDGDCLALKLGALHVSGGLCARILQSNDG